MNPLLELRNIRAGYGTIDVLHGVSFAIGAGQMYALLGPNGAGKTTTIRLLLGMLRPTSGRAEIFGLDVQRDTVAAHRRRSRGCWAGLGWCQ